MSEKLEGIYILREDQLKEITRNRDRGTMERLWKERHKLRPQCYHEVSFEPDQPVPGMPRRWDCWQLKPSDDLNGKPCCRDPQLVYNMKSNQFWCENCGEFWVEDRGKDYQPFNPDDPPPWKKTPITKVS